MRSPRVAFVAASAVVVAIAAIWHFAAAPDAPGSPEAEPTRARVPTTDEDSADQTAFESEASARELLALRREPGACAVVFPSGDAHLSDEIIALAVLDTFDVGTKRTRTESARGDGAFTVTSCSGTRVQAWPRAELARENVIVLSSLVTGAPELAEDAGLGSSVVARVVIGEVPGPCARAKGFLVLAALRERRLEIDALAEWEGTCGSIEPLSIIRLGREFALLEEDSDTEGDGESPPTEWSRVWLRRGAALVHVGNVQTRLEDENEGRSMTAELVSSPRGVIARETWTHQPADGSASMSKVIERAYVLDGLKLE